MLEQQRILRERGVQNEMERKEKERLEEEERLQTLKRIEKRPLSKKRNDHENYYENTMNAAGKTYFNFNIGFCQHIWLTLSEPNIIKALKMLVWHLSRRPV